MTHKRYRALILLWLLCPVALITFHYGPGERYQIRAKARQLEAAARKAETSGNWTNAMNHYDAALAILSEAPFEAQARVRILRANAMMYDGQLSEATEDLQALLNECQTQNSTDAPINKKLVDRTRAALGASCYYLGWVRRLEGVPREEWLAETSRARQHFRLLAESRDQQNQEAESPFLRNLEAAVRLERMDISELQALPLPEPVGAGQGSKEGKQKGNKSGKGKRPGEGEGKAEDIRGAGKGHRPTERGS